MAKRGLDGIISIHAPRTGSDRQPCHLRNEPRISIHAPRTGSDPTSSPPLRTTSVFQSTLPARGATRSGMYQTPAWRKISIHAPRTGSDMGSILSQSAVLISIHAPRTGSDPTSARRRRALRQFQSTLPARGATRKGQENDRRTTDFNPRSPHGERQDGPRPEQEDTIFQSTLPARGATTPARRASRASTHFNPRSPHGERRH